MGDDQNRDPQQQQQNNPQRHAPGQQQQHGGQGLQGDRNNHAVRQGGQTGQTDGRSADGQGGI